MAFCDKSVRKELFKVPKKMPSPGNINPFLNSRNSAKHHSLNSLQKQVLLKMSRSPMKEVSQLVFSPSASPLTNRVSPTIKITRASEEFNIIHPSKNNNKENEGDFDSDQEFLKLESEFRTPKKGAPVVEDINSAMEDQFNCFQKSYEEDRKAIIDLVNLMDQKFSCFSEQFKLYLARSKNTTLKPSQSPANLIASSQKITTIPVVKKTTPLANSIDASLARLARMEEYKTRFSEMMAEYEKPAPASSTKCPTSSTKKVTFNFQQQREAATKEINNAFQDTPNTKTVKILSNNVRNQALTQSMSLYTPTPKK